MSTPVNIALSNLPTMSLDFGEWTEANRSAIRVTPNWEPLETQLFINLLSSRPRVLDIGANIGWFTCVGAKIAGSAGRFCAFEPEPDNFAALINNISANRLFNVQPFRVALGEEDRDGQLFLCHDNLGDHRTYAVEGRASIPIQIAKLDTILGDMDFVPDLIKIDVQGGESGVLGGGTNVLARAGKQCAILMEFWPGGMKGGVPEAMALAETIFSWGQTVYVCHHVGTGSICETSIETLFRAINGCIHPSKPAYIDILIAPDDGRMDRLRTYIGPAFEPWE